MNTDEWKSYFELQANHCTRDGSPLYGALIHRVGRDFATGGVVAELLDGWEGNPVLQALAMRLVGAVHDRVLAGEAPELARHYPSAGGQPIHPEVEDVFIATVEQHREFIAKRLHDQVQTNEVRRSAALLGGFLEIAAATGLPLRLLEIGASAGLNQLWDRYRYELGPHRWGDAGGTPVLTTEWRGPAPRIDAPLRVASRQGCDIAPVDLSDVAHRRRLESFVWPDQPERRERFLRAAEVVVANGVELECSSALPWLERQLASPSPGLATVLFHSVMWLYLDAEERHGIEALMQRVGESRDDAAPLAWLRMEARNFETCELRLRVWPRGDDRLLGTCGFHGQHVEWSG